MEVRFVGNIGKDAVKRTVGEPGSEYSVTSIWVCENIQKANGTELKVWRKVTLWRGFADKLTPYLKKGRRVEIDGIAGETKFYTNSENKVVPYDDIRCTKLTFMDSKRPDTDTPPETEPAAEVVAQGYTEANQEETPW